MYIIGDPGFVAARQIAAEPSRDTFDRRLPRAASLTWD
jgi:hypothetical protein